MNRSRSVASDQCTNGSSPTKGAGRTELDSGFSIRCGTPLSSDRGVHPIVRQLHVIFDDLMKVAKLDLLILEDEISFSAVSQTRMHGLVTGGILIEHDTQTGVDKFLNQAFGRVCGRGQISPGLPQRAVDRERPEVIGQTQVVVDPAEENDHEIGKDQVEIEV